MRFLMISFVVMFTACSSGGTDDTSTDSETGGRGNASGGSAGNAGRAEAGVGGSLGAGGSAGGGGSSAGGSTGTGGHGTDAGPLTDASFDAVGAYDGPVSDAACPGLPASGWQNVSPPGSDYTNNYSGLNAVAVRPDNPAVVYVGANLHGIFKSTDCGATWAVAATGANAATINAGEPWSVVIDPVVPDVMYASLGYGAQGLWKSTNGGADWQQTMPSSVTSAFANQGQITGVSIDPGDHTHVVVESHGNCTSGNACAAETTDAGATWKLIEMTGAGAWQENSAIVIVNRATWLYCGLFGGLFRTVDEGASWQTVNVGGALPSCNYYEPYLWQAVDGRYYLPAITYGGPGLLKSQPNDTGSWALIPNSPQANVLMPTASNLVLGRSTASGAPPPTDYSIASQSDPSTWKTLVGPPAGSPSGTNIGGGPEFMAYDRVHHALYVSTFSTGLWQTVLQ
jgi:hypothetical protein